MPSIIEGYSYDIFISYRQKDNKGERWVSKFVDALKTELESTFKDNISIYFDENPYDRLQDTHNVDKSLEGKLKCLIFIPIISQTYCDSRSYAWQYEFLAFNRLAEKDQYGKDVKLRSGNVASRILPIRIYDLDDEDAKLFEKESGSILRALDFVFKTSSGVNRPLRANEDHPNDNLNKTFYRDQINKVANAIKEIIGGLKTELVVSPVKEKTQQREPVERTSVEGQVAEQVKPFKLSNRKLISGVAIVAIIVIIAIIFYPKIFKRDTLERLRASGERISIAVLPFQNMTGDTTKNDWQSWIQENLTSCLSNFSENIQVRQTESINDLLKSKNANNYASLTVSVASLISRKLDVNVFIYGNLIQESGKIRLTAQLINAKTKEVFMSFQKEGDSERIMPIVDSLSAQIRNFLLIEILKKENVEFQKIRSTNSPLAYKYFILGKNARYRGDQKSANKWFKDAIEIDSNFIWAMSYIPTTSLNIEEGKQWCLRLYSKRDIMNLQEKIWTEYLYSQFFETPNECLIYLKQFKEEIDDQWPPLYFNFGLKYLYLAEYDKAIPEFEKALEIYDKWNLKPLGVIYYTYLGEAYHKTGQYKKEKKLYKISEKDFPDNPFIIQRQAALTLTVGNTNAANEHIEKYKSIQRDNRVSEANIAAALGRIYYEGGIPGKTEEYFRQALSLEPENPIIMNNLAFFLIDNEININEGLELIDEALKLSPDNFNYLHTKGWGLYKQGKYQEAKDILQKSWDLRRKLSVYNHEASLHLEAAKKAVASQKNN